MADNMTFDQCYEKYFPEETKYLKNAIKLGNLGCNTVEELTKMLAMNRMKIENEDMINHMLPIKTSYQGAAIMQISYGNIKGNLENCLNECNCSEEFKDEIRKIASSRK